MDVTILGELLVTFLNPQQPLSQSGFLHFLGDFVFRGGLAAKISECLDIVIGYGDLG
jgi:hypothetical protein